MPEPRGGRPTLLLLEPLMPRIAAGAGAFADIVAITDPVMLKAGDAREARALATTWHWRIDDGLLDRLPRLELIAHFGAGVDAVDREAVRRRGIVLANTPDAVTEETADLALGLLLMTVRRLGAAERYLRDGGWARAPFPLSATSLRDRTIGILGMGRIGQAIARRLAGFGRPIHYHARHRRDALPYAYAESPRALAAEVDTLVAVLPGGDATRHLIDAGLLEALGPRGILVNVGRGSSVDEAALLAALAAGAIAGAGLDVFENEPHPLPGLIGRDDVVLLPHIGTATRATREAMADAVVANLRSWFAEGRALTPVA